VSSLWKSLPAATAETARARLRSGCAAVDKEMRREGVTLVLLWAVSRRASGRVWLYYSWFSEHYDAFKSRLRPTMRQSYSAGEKVFADFAGDAIDVVDPTTAEVRPMKLFVAVMGASNYIFAQARPSEQVAIASTRMWTCSPFWAACPKFVVCDNLKAAVTNPDRYEPGLNRPKFFRLDLAKPSNVTRRCSISP
jgi:transposase